MIYLILIAVAVFVLNGLRHAERQTGNHYTGYAIFCIASVGFGLARIYIEYVAV